MVEHLLIIHNTLSWLPALEKKKVIVKKKFAFLMLFSGWYQTWQLEYLIYKLRKIIQVLHVLSVTVAKERKKAYCFSLYASYFLNMYTFLRLTDSFLPF